MTARSISSPFHLVLISTSSLNEFENTNSSFKNRLPVPISLQGGEWEVALDDISLPSNTSFMDKVNPSDRTNLITTYFSRRKRNPGPTDVDTAYALNFTKFDLEEITPTVDGVGFMKTIFDSLEKWRVEDVIDTDPRFSYTVNGKEQQTYWRWKWEGDELVSDNVDMYKADPTTRPLFLIDLAMGAKMGWFKYNDATNQYDLGPNLKQELFDPNIVPEINGSGNDGSQGDVFEPYTSLHTNAGKRVFWTANDPNWGRTGVSPDRNYARLSYHCNWRFINLNAAFQEAKGSVQRTLLCYSDVCSPSTVGSQNVDLLREVTFKEGTGGTVYYEPHRLQHLAVRTGSLSVISVEIAEKDGSIAKFHEGPTTVTLHFQPI